MNQTQLALSLVLLVSAPQIASAVSSVTIDFDHDAAGNPLSAGPVFSGEPPLTNLYAPLGLLVRGPSPGDGPAILNEIGNFGVNARSGANFLATNAASNLATGGVPRDPVDFLFPNGITAFSIYASGGFSQSTYHLEAFDNMQQSLGDQDFFSPTGAYTLLSFTSAFPITTVRIDAVDNTVVMDDLTFTPVVPEPAGATLVLVAIAGISLRRVSRRSR